jgi:hypothetical protein
MNLRPHSLLLQNLSFHRTWFLWSAALLLWCTGLAKLVTPLLSPAGAATGDPLWPIVSKDAVLVAGGVVEISVALSLVVLRSERRL